MRLPLEVPAVVTLPFLDVKLLDEAYQFDMVGKPSSRLGREVIRARGVPRDTHQPRREFHFELDAEYGTVLRRASFEDGQLVGLTVAVSVEYDLELSPRMFVPPVSVADYLLAEPMPGLQ